MELAWCSGSVMDCHATARPGFDSRWERCIYQASCPLQGTVNGGAVSKWPRCQKDVKHNQPTLHTTLQDNSWNNNRVMSWDPMGQKSCRRPVKHKYTHIITQCFCREVSCRVICVCVWCAVGTRFTKPMTLNNKQGYWSIFVLVEADL